MSVWTCTECDWNGTDQQWLTAENPFDPNSKIIGCPLCKDVGSMRELCDEPGCSQLASCGFPTEDGSYRRTCFDHSKFKQDKDKEKP